MKKLIGLTSLAAVLSFTSAASAVEAGQWYVRADAAYAATSSKKPTIISTSTTIASDSGLRFKGFIPSIGVGYNVTEEVRTDLVLGFPVSFKSNKNDDLGATSTSTKYKKAIELMANGYYDFNNSTGFTPYLMAGLGMERFTLSAPATVTNSNNGTTFTFSSKAKTAFRYQVGLGAAFEFTKGAFIDLGYRIGNANGGAIDITGTGGAFNAQKARLKVKNSIRNTFSAGVRFSF